eukprot:CAMPEP_0117551716 /NCGR_PEP_ID=MMETSP0784-20121206/49332_1 /TAXON_ID=39447 /ORGANISM="" /LENGTH=45 /DNA_ID= /DNA_START= /DNA_END= /DNA_ORIENTATION=
MAPGQDAVRRRSYNNLEPSALSMAFKSVDHFASFAICTGRVEALV